MASEDDEDDDDGESKKTPLLYIILAIVLIVAVLTAIIIIVVYFVVLKADKKNLNQNDEMESRAKMGDAARNETDSDERSKQIVVISHKFLNFTDADDFCRNMNSSNKRLFFPKSYDDEKALYKEMKLLNIEDSDSTIQKTCRNDYFVGLRKALDKDWKTLNDEYVFGPPIVTDTFLSREDPSEQCVGIKEHGEELRFRTIDCDDSDGWNCILCETPCQNSSTGLCYKVYIDKFMDNFNDALEYCEELDPPAVLASAKHKSVLNTIRSQISNDMATCDVVGIGQQFTHTYESIDEKPLAYETDNILYRPQRNADSNCLAMSIEEELKWEPVDCSVKRCFICNE